jgi:transcriptional regulator GlxA family with amidase domain
MKKSTDSDQRTVEARDAEIIVTGDERLTEWLRQVVPPWIPLRVYGSVGEFARYAADASGRRTIAAHVFVALREIGMEQATLPLPLQPVLNRIARSSVTPRVADVIPGGFTKDHFCRIWKRYFPETLSRFLRRVRILHAISLMEEEGMTQEAAAEEAGYSSDRRLRAAMRERRCRAHI